MFDNLVKKTNRQDPIQNSMEDKLNRSSFVNYVINIIETAPIENNSFVIAINGKWGEGKTSVKNLIYEKLVNKNKDNRNLLLEYNYLEFQNQKDLQKNFITKLLKESKQKQKKFRLLNIIYLNFSKILISSIIIYILFVLIKNPKQILNFSSVISVILIIFYNIKSFFLKTSSFEKLLEIIQKIILKLDVFFKLIDYNEIRDSNTSSEKLKEHISTNPEFIYDKIFIFIDSFDSLELTQINILIKFININLILSNCVFILFYDKEIITNCLNTNAYSGSDFLEKFVNVQLDLPLITEKYLFSFLQSELEEKYNINIEIMYRFKYIKDYFSSLNKIYSFLDTFDLNYKITLNNTSNANINFNKNDFLFLEILRFFENNLYREIRKNKLVLTCFDEEILNEIKDDINIEILQKERCLLFDNLFLNLTHKHNIKNLKDLVVDLFPQFQIFINNDIVININSLLKLKSVGTYQFFDYYFIYDLSEHNISEEDFLNLIPHLNNNRDFINNFKSIFHIVNEDMILLFSANFLNKLNEKIKLFKHINILYTTKLEECEFLKNIIWLYAYSNNLNLRRTVLNILIKYTLNSDNIIKLLESFEILLSSNDLFFIFYIFEILIMIKEHFIDSIFYGENELIKDSDKLIKSIIFRYINILFGNNFLFYIRKNNFFNMLLKNHICLFLRYYFMNKDIVSLENNKYIKKYVTSQIFFDFKKSLFNENFSLFYQYLSYTLHTKTVEEKKYYTINANELYPFTLDELIKLFYDKQIDNDDLIFKVLIKLKKFKEYESKNVLASKNILKLLYVSEK